MSDSNVNVLLWENLIDSYSNSALQAKKIASWGENVYVKIPITNSKGEKTFNLVKKLLSIGSQVTTLSLKRKRYKIKNKNLKYIFCDYTNFKALKKKINKPFEYVVNLGGYIDHSKFFVKGKSLIDNHYR